MEAALLVEKVCKEKGKGNPCKATMEALLMGTGVPCSAPIEEE